MEKDLVAKCENAFYDMLNGMYYDEEIDFGDCKIVLSDTITDNLWNYATRVQTKNPEKLINNVSNFMEITNLQPAFYLTPNYKPDYFEKILEEKGFISQVTDAWMFFKGKPKQKNRRVINLMQVKNEQEMKIFYEVYKKAFSYSPEDNPGPDEYEKAIIDSIQKNFRRTNIQNYIAFDGSIPASILTLANKNDLFGIYNVGTIPDFRKKGLSSALISFSIEKAFCHGAKEIFLQTDANSKNEKFYKELGFTTEFLAKNYVKE